MPNRQWLDEFRCELTRRKLPRPEVARLVAELSDHLADMMDSRCSTDRKSAEEGASCPSFSQSQEVHRMDANVIERLGSPSNVAESALREYRQRGSVLSRSRLAAFCTFVLSPLPVLFLAWLASVAVIAALGDALTSVVPDPTDRWPITPRAEPIIQGVFVAYVVIAAVVVSAFYGRLARKTAHQWRWGLAACLLVALGSMSVHTHFQVKRSEVPGKNQVLFGVGFKTNFLKASRLIQFALPLGAGLLVLRRSARSIALPDELPPSQSGNSPDESGVAQAA